MPRTPRTPCAPLLAAALIALAGPAPVAGHALDGPPAIADELHGINQQLRFARSRLEEATAATGDAPLEVLSRAQVAYFEGDHPAAAARLLDLVARPGFREHPAYADALAWLGESLWALGLEAAAVDALRDSLEAPRQSPVTWRRNFARYLSRARDREPLDRLRAYWQRFQGLPPSESDEADFAELTYHYGRALFRGGALDEAAAAFRAVPADARDALRAQYFVGVVALKQGELVLAGEAFEQARQAWLTRSAEVVPRVPTPLDAIPSAGPRRAYARVNADGELVPSDRQDEAAAAAEALDPDDEIRHVRRMGAVIHLALARLAAAREDDAAAWQWYRMIPPGDPDHAQALSEATFVLFRLGEFDWCVRLVDQLLATRGDDLSAAQLGLWRAQLLARAARYEDARESYRDLEAAMKRRLTELDGALQTDQRLFPAAALAWTAPEDARRARRLEAELVLQEEALLEARELAASLAELARAADALPVVRDGRALHARLVERLAHTRTHVDSPPAPDARGPDRATLTTSAERLAGRLADFARFLETYAAACRARLQRVIDAEQPELERLTAALAAEQAAARDLAAELRVAARSNLDRFAAESMFGEVDLAWWRKEEVSRLIREETARRDAAKAAMEAEPAPAGPESPAPESPTPESAAEPADELLPVQGAPTP